jgi:four helix bundle protein
MEGNKNTIKSFRDLEVYRDSYDACIVVHKQLLARLPKTERYDLRDQLSRSTKAIPRLIAEGYAKRHQRAGFQKYLDDAMAESNETIVGIDQIRDIYCLEEDLCNQLVASYDKLGRQLYRLAEAWNKFKSRSK